MLSALLVNTLAVNRLQEEDNNRFVQVSLFTELVVFAHYMVGFNEFFQLVAVW